MNILDTVWYWLSCLLTTVVLFWLGFSFKAFIGIYVLDVCISAVCYGLGCVHCSLIIIKDKAGQLMSWSCHANTVKKAHGH